MVEGGRKVVEGGRKVVEGGQKVVEGGRMWLADGWKWLKVVLGLQNCFYWGDPLLFLGGFQLPRPPGGGPAAPRAPLINF